MTHTPLIYYWSSPTGNTAALAHNIPHTTLPIAPHTRTIQPYILLTPSYDQPKGGFIPKQVERFLEHNSHHMVGVIGTGNRTFGTHYCQSAQDISSKYGVPVLWRVEIMGTEKDHDVIDHGINQHWDALVSMRLS